MTFSNDTIILQELTLDNAPHFYEIYKQRKLMANFEEETFYASETEEDFTKRIMSVCNFAFTIRLKEKPDEIIGDCELHHCNKAKGEIEIGGSLLPGYQGHGLMEQAFLLLMDFARQEMDMHTIIVKTNVLNEHALSLARKMDFSVSENTGKQIILKKEI